MHKLKLLIFCFSLLVIKIGNSQVPQYEPYPLDSTIWTGIFATFDYSENFKLSFLGDTVINGLMYNKVCGYYPENGFYTFENGIAEFFEEPGEYIGGLRQDTINEKMFFADTTGVEYDISIDVNLDIGDHLIVPEHYEDLFVVPYNILDSIVVASYSGQSFILDIYHPDFSSPFWGSYKIGEGFKAISGLEFTLWDLSTFCYREPGDTNHAPPCASFGENKEESTKDLSVTIGPNPINDQLFIYSNFSLLGGVMRVYDSAGKRVSIEILEDETEQVVSFPFASGIYYVHFSQPLMDSEIHKILKLGN